MTPAASGKRRDDAIRKAHAEGATIREIAQTFDLSPGRVHQILHSQPGAKVVTLRPKTKAKTKAEAEEKVKNLAQYLNELHKTAAVDPGNRSALARALDTDRKNVYRWLDGQNEPEGTTLLDLFVALGVEVIPKPPDQRPRPMNVELAEVRERVEAIEASVVAQGFVLREIADRLRVEHEGPSSALGEQNTRP